MIGRQITRTRKGPNGEVTHVCNPAEWWGPRSKGDVIRDIEAWVCSYYVVRPGVGRVNVRVVEGPFGKYLRTDSDWLSANNLSELPDC